MKFVATFAKNQAPTSSSVVRFCGADIEKRHPLRVLSTDKIIYNKVTPTRKRRIIRRGVAFRFASSKTRTTERNVDKAARLKCVATSAKIKSLLQVRLVRFRGADTKKQHPLRVLFFSGDSYENRTRVTAVKGRCLNRLTKEPYLFGKNRKFIPNCGSGGQIRTNDLPGMNRPL